MDKLKIVKVELGFDVEAEIQKVINAEVDLTEARKLAANKTPQEKSTQECATIQTCLNFITENKSITKDKLCELSGLSLLSAIGRVNGALKKTNQKLMKLGKDSYTLSDLTQPTSLTSE